MKKTAFILCIALLLNFSLLSMSSLAAPQPGEISAPSAILMERSSGEIIFEKDADVPRPPASVTKVMTMLLVAEAVDNGQITKTDMVTISPYAASMGGSQIFLEPGETMSVTELLKSVAVSSANDAAVALAELIAGSEEGFVSRMNERAGELGMKNTSFKNCTGLDAEGHLTTARDIALMSRELLSHPMIKEYTTIWMDSVRGGAFTLANTNKLVRFYKGCTGLKTGFTSQAKYCLSASAVRDSMELVSVVMGADSSDMRFDSARKLLDFGFANYALVDVTPKDAINSLPVKMGVEDFVTVVPGESALRLMDKSKVRNIESSAVLPERVDAPIKKGDKIGELVVKNDGVEIAHIPLVAGNDVDKLSMPLIFGRMFADLFGGKRK